jgi:hypothetical protein
MPLPQQGLVLTIMPLGRRHELDAAMAVDMAVFCAKKISPYMALRALSRVSKKYLSLWPGFLAVQLWVLFVIGNLN